MHKVRMEITKEEEVCFISHLDYARAMERAIRRAKLPAAYSEGFNPHMKLAFASALSVGVTSDAEYADIAMLQKVKATDFIDKRTSNIGLMFGNESSTTPTTSTQESGKLIDSTSQDDGFVVPPFFNEHE